MSTPLTTTARAIRQRLESLQAAGVTVLPRRAGRRQPPDGPIAIATTSDAATSAVGELCLRDPPPRHSPSTSEPMAKKTIKNRAPSKAPSKAPTLKVLQQEVADCTACGELASTRTQTVFGVGNPKARLVLLGEAPGAKEDEQGEPFVGRSGQLLTKMLEACHLSRDKVYILNTLKCRPPGNRNPTPEESQNCRRFLRRQLDLIDPEFICCLGAVAAHNFLETTTPIGKLRGKVHLHDGRKVVCTYHPAYLLRNPSAKKPAWEDLQMLMRELGIEV